MDARAVSMINHLSVIARLKFPNSLLQAVSIWGQRPNNMPHKIPFRVVHVSGQDENFKAVELNSHNPNVRGWHSTRFCLYPQDLVIYLEQKCRLRKIQILSHQFLIRKPLSVTKKYRLSFHLLFDFLCSYKDRVLCWRRLRRRSTFTAKCTLHATWVKIISFSITFPPRSVEQAQRSTESYKKQ